MANNDKEHAAYVEKVREENQSYIRQLLNDIDTLRVTLAQLETENARLQKECGAARDEIAFREGQERRLQDILQEIRQESEQRLVHFAQLEQHNANLANLYVASYQLHGTVDRDAVIAALQEIVVNLVGSEEFVICHRDERGADFIPVASVGVDVTSHQRDAIIMRTLEAGETWVSASEEETSLTVCIPLKLDGRVTGYIAIYRLLPHKKGLEPLDHELFDLLATHAATALFCTSLASEFAGRRSVSA